jgi:subtilisin family serine protease
VLVFAGCGNGRPSGSAGAGNSGLGGDPTPAGQGGALSGAGAGGVGGNSGAATYSTTQPFVSAPGFTIPTTDLIGASGYTATNYVKDFQGTSAVAAHVAGLAALLLAHNPRLTASDVRTIVYRTADKVGGTFSPSDANHPDGSWNQNVGYGRINARNAVIEARRVRAEVTEITGSDPAVIDFGTVQPGTTAQIVIRLRHATTLCTHPITFVLPTALPAHVQWAPGTPASIVLASGATQTVVLQYAAPSTAEEVSGTIQFLSDDFLARSITLSVHAS